MLLIACHQKKFEIPNHTSYSDMVTSGSSASSALSSWLNCFLAFSSPLWESWVSIKKCFPHAMYWNIGRRTRTQPKFITNIFWNLRDYKSIHNHISKDIFLAFIKWFVNVLQPRPQGVTIDQFNFPETCSFKSIWGWDRMEDGLTYFNLILKARLINVSSFYLGSRRTGQEWK